MALIDDVPTCLVMVRRLIAEAEEAYCSVGKPSVDAKDLKEQSLSYTAAVTHRIEPASQ